MDELEKYHRVYAQIDLDAIYENVKVLKSNIRDTAKITAVIKADGYGHGAVPIAKAIDDLVSSYAVATIHEAINLREHNINKPIYIIGYTHHTLFNIAVEQEIRLTVYDYETALEIDRVSEKLGLIAKIHLKIDTGMNRIGFTDNIESLEIIQRINELENIYIEGVFTHFAGADMRDKTSSFQQIERFQHFISLLEERGIQIPVIHCANSAAIIDLPETSFTNARAGIAIYGLYPSDEVNKTEICLRPALSLKSHIIQLKKVDSGTGIGYGSTYITKRETWVATIPIGYGDGYPRNLSNKGYVLIQGKKAPIVGRVCMDQIMVDVTDVTGIKKGEVVTLIGVDGKEKISVEELSELAGTFNYEFVCGLGKRIPRIYVKDKKIVCVKDYFHDSYTVNL